MKVTLDGAIELGINKLVRSGVPQNEAEVASLIFLEGELWGKRTHGFRYMKNSLDYYHNASNYRRELRVERATGTSVLIDGGFHFGHFVHDVGMRQAIEQANHSGFGMVGVHNAGISGMLGYYSQMATEAGLIGIAINGTPPKVVPPRGILPMLGTNPLTIGIPRTGHQPVILDMSTSSISYHGLVQARREHTQLSPNMALDQYGNPTTDPEEAFDTTLPTIVQLARILPFAGYKGFGLSFMIEILSQASFGAPIGMSRLAPDINESANGNGMYLVFRPDLFVEREVFDARVTQLITDVQNDHEAGSTTPIRIPGEQSQQRRAAALQAGWIDIEDATYAFLRD